MVLDVRCSIQTLKITVSINHVLNYMIRISFCTTVRRTFCRSDQSVIWNQGMSNVNSVASSAEVFLSTVWNGRIGQFSNGVAKRDNYSKIVILYLATFPMWAVKLLKSMSKIRSWQHLTLTHRINKSQTDPYGHIGGSKPHLPGTFH